MPTFELKASPRGKVVEYVSHVLGVDVVHRPATDEDRRLYASAYRAFLKPESLAATVETPVAPALLSESAADPEATPSESPKKRSLFRKK